MIPKAPAALIFDLDDTLIPSSRFYAPAVAKALDQSPKLLAVYEDARKKVKADLPPLHTSARNRLLYFKRLTEIADTGGVSALVLCDRYEKELSCLISHWSVAEERLQLIRILQTRYPTFILTNENTRAQLLKIEALCQGQPHGFRGIVCSEEVGFEKPHSAIFQNLFDRFQLRPEICLLIGDSAENDIRAAENWGIPAIQSQEFLADQPPSGRSRVITHLKELLDILP